MKTNWQHIEEGELKHSSEHHLMAIYHLREKFGYARVTDISNYLKITRGSVSITLTKLNESEFIAFDANKHITLTPKGEEIVKAILNRRDILRDFFVNSLLLDKVEANNCACKLEHVISDDIVDRIKKLLNFTLDKDIKEKLAQHFTTK